MGREGRTEGTATLFHFSLREYSKLSIAHVPEMFKNYFYSFSSGKNTDVRNLLTFLERVCIVTFKRNSRPHIFTLGKHFTGNILVYKV